MTLFIDFADEMDSFGSTNVTVEQQPDLVVDPVYGGYIESGAAPTNATIKAVVMPWVGMAKAFGTQFDDLAITEEEPRVYCVEGAPKDISTGVSVAIQTATGSKKPTVFVEGVERWIAHRIIDLKTMGNMNVVICKQSREPVGA